jgi:hypothetical protein
MELRVMRAMAWERAKAELRGMLTTYVEDGEGFEKAKKMVETFIRKADDEGIAE